MECGLSNGQVLFAPVFCGVGFGGGSAPTVVDVCVATQVRGLIADSGGDRSLLRWVSKKETIRWRASWAEGS